MLKKVLIGFGALLVLVMVLGGALWSGLDSIVKAAVEKYGSEAAQVTVELAGVDLSLASGKGKLSGLRIDNPEGFKAADAFFLGMIDVSVDTESLAGDGPIVIKNITIDKPQVTLEVNEKGGSNLQTIADNAKKYAGEQTEKSAAPKASGKAAEAERKIIVKKLTVSGGEVAIAHAMLKDKALEAKIPTFTLRNLGENSGGLTSAQLAGQLMSVITHKASTAATSSFVKSLGLPQAIDGVKANMGDLKSNAIDDMKAKTKDLLPSW